MYIPRNWVFGQAFSKLQNFGGGGLNPPNTSPGYASASGAPKGSVLACNEREKKIAA
jgi:hypothetical protein